MNTQIGTSVHRAAALLLGGSVVGIPTETVYGLAANALDVVAVSEIFKVKNRPRFDPLIVHLPSFKAAKDYTLFIPPMAHRLAEAFCPGPITFLLPKSDRIPDLVTSGSERVAIRVPAHPLTLELLQVCGLPLAAPSANPFGYISPVTAQHVADQLGGKIEYILDGGPSVIGLESTIVGFEGDQVRLYRPGGISIERLEAICGRVATATVSSENHPQAPGMLTSHYAPRKPLRLIDASEAIESDFPSDTLLLCLKRPLQWRGPVLELSATGSLDEAASNLFSALRTMDQSGAPLLLAIPVPEKELGRAINDRLRRAAV